MPDIFKPLPKVTEEPTTNESVAQPVKPIPHSNESMIQQSLRAPFTIGKPLGLLASFHLHPQGIFFENQENDEHIVLFIRRHFVINVPWILLTLFLLFIPPIALALLHFSGLVLFNVPPQLFYVILAFYYLNVSTR